MARVAYVMNDIMDKLGLSGRAFIPMVLGLDVQFQLSWQVVPLNLKKIESA